LYHVQGVSPSYKNLPTFYSSCCIMYKEFHRVTRIYPHSTAAVVSCTRSSSELQESTPFYSSCCIMCKEFPRVTRIYPHSTGGTPCTWYNSCCRMWVDSCNSGKLLAHDTTAAVEWGSCCIMYKEFPWVTRIYPILQQLLYHVQGVPLSYKNLPTFYSSCCIMYKEFPWVTRIYPHSTAAVVSCTRSSPELQESIHILQQLFYHIRGVQSATRIYPHSTAAVLSHTRSSKCYTLFSHFVVYYLKNQLQIY
jgi:hypothetical protein